MWRKLKMCDEKSYVMALAEISCQSAAQDLDGVGSSRLANYFLFSGPSRLRLRRTHWHLAHAKKHNEVLLTPSVPMHQRRGYDPTDSPHPCYVAMPIRH
jgi:hypothetical protein